MGLKEELEALWLDHDKIRELTTERSFRKLSEEDQNALRSFFHSWAEAEEKGSQTTSSASFIALGFILGHNWVKEHWVLW